MRLKLALLAMFLGLSANGCETIGKEPYLDRKFSASPKAYTNVFEFLKNYEKQVEAPGQGARVRAIRYYEQNQRYVGYSNKANNWFSVIGEDEIKQRMVKIIKRSSSGGSANLDGIVGPVRVVEGLGFYLQDGPCYFISVVKRTAPHTGYDNDYGAPDFVGFFHICNGLTVTPKEFIEKIGLANDDAEARYVAIVSKQSHSAPPNNRDQANQKEIAWERRSIAVQWTGISELIAGEISIQQGKQNGRIKLTLPKARGLCDGTYAMTERRKGAWSIACTNGVSASGTMVAYGSGKGSSGEGQDDKGRTVKFTVGGR